MTIIPGLISWLTKLVVRVWEKPSLYFFIFFVIFTIDRHHRYEYTINEHSPFYSDVHEYYRILPNSFIDGSDVGVGFYKTTFGMAIMYAPGFFVGHVLAGFSDELQDGFSEPYRWAVRWTSIIYVIIGLWFVRLSLIRFFSEFAAFVTLITVFFTTNLFFYTYGWGEYPHGYLFCLFSVLIYSTIRWVDNGCTSSLFLMAGVLGLSVLIRPTSIFIVLFPLFYRVNSAPELIGRLQYLIRNSWKLIISVFLFFIPIFLQMLYWKIQTGNFLYWSYRGESFYFNDPQIINFLFSYRKGWFVYTPSMGFAVIGLVFLWKKARELFFPVILILLISIYVLSSWWEWSYGGSFGCRAMVEFYAFLSFPLAALIETVFRYEGGRRWMVQLIRAGLLVLIFLLINLNMWLTSLYRHSVIHWNGMNKEAFWYIMKKDQFVQEDYEYLYSVFTPPDNEAMLRGERDQ